jgi:predicted RNase H-like HicB family nuclease
MLAAECPAIPGRGARGQTAAQALDDIREAIARCPAARVAHWMALDVN